MNLLLPVLATAACATILAAAIIAATLPLLQRHALAQPNARSSHRIPTPQGAGFGVIAATLIAANVALHFFLSSALPGIGLLTLAAVGIACLGALDDLRSLPVLPRFLLQGLAVAATLAALPDAARINDLLPLWLERALLFVAALYFVNIVNFMDGLDWMTVAEVVPVGCALVMLGLLGQLTASSTLIAAALTGAYLGFAPFNRPVAKIFLGDVGSLATGLLLAWCLIDLAGHDGFVAALLLPLYYLADASWTLVARIWRGEKFWQSHRSHCYQRATDNGLSVIGVVGRVLALNVALAALAIASALTAQPVVQILLLFAGLAGVLLTMRDFAKSRR
jgi:UDP-N-acetylmuramyl pentapeptide phosphotransferase/UDP-N-acetylglucosamine-1-phosphate transferase